MEALPAHRENSSSLGQVCPERFASMEHGADHSPALEKEACFPNSTISETECATRVDEHDLTGFYEELGKNSCLFPDTSYSSENDPNVIFAPQIGNAEPDKKESSTSRNLQDQLNDLHVAVGKVIEKQNAVTAKRAQASELRVGLRHKRDEEGHLRAELLKSLNLAITLGQPGNADSMLSTAERFQTSSDAYLVLENEYHQFEDQLEQDKYVLEKMEQRLSSLLDKFGSLTGSRIGDQGGLQSFGVDDNDNDSSSTSSSEHDKYPPLLLNICLGLEMLAFFVDLSDMKESFSRLGRALDEESQAFLSSYEDVKSELQKELYDTEQDVARLKAECEAEGLLPRPPQESTTTRFYQTLKEELPKKHGSLWSPGLEDTGPFFEQDMSQRSNMPVFINKWILHQLRHSSIEISRLKSILQLEWNLGWETSIRSWVLKLWFKDDTAATSPPQTPSVTGTSWMKDTRQLQ
ncbi:hypothetical protein T310_3295 [Rasamsonia emersonii CBS 393.64]|uniref:Uncharacterized protein n=1 Tax=Rasamsonia emersonii (strain ATCC 16479 / CBS 393.64 / IMI 116815) TaxID=1408163 RepID=A0A0F4YXX8_RASE3|nr:hypothetical protein T310_3295 [Rasamsonia emersonii CBS 393.64]KKA22676.1 hypothetical protein T310_3295 [Rasamsonia emersonii CBS 393.64]